MSTAQITGGAATFEKNRKVADFESEKACITFNVGEGDDAEGQVQRALAMAKMYVFQALGLTKAPAPQGEVPADPKPPAEKPKRAPKTPPTVPAAETKPAAEPLAAPSADAPQIRTNPENRVDPLDLDPTVASPATVTDQQISDAVTRKNAALIASAKAAGQDGAAGTKKIKDLVAQFQVSRSSELPQGVRADFLAKLEKLS